MSSEENKRDPEIRDDAYQEEGALEDAEGAPEGTEAEPVTGEEPGLQWDEATVLSMELEATRRDRDQYLDALRRLKAEFENSRKR